MPYIFGSSPKTILLKHESHKLHHTFTVEDNVAILTFSADLVTSNVINITVDGVAMAEVTFTTDHITTMGLIETALETLDSVESAVTFGATNRKIKLVVANNANPFVVITGLVTLGASQATITATYNQNHLSIGRQVILNPDGKIAPAQPESTTQQIIGTVINTAIEGEEVTVAMKAFAIIFAECETALLVAGPVRLGSASVYNATTGYVLVDDLTVDHVDQIGWALDIGGIGDIIRVALL